MRKINSVAYNYIYISIYIRFPIRFSKFRSLHNE